MPGRPDKALGAVEAMTFDQVAALVQELGEPGTDNQSDAVISIGSALDAYVARAEKTKGESSMVVIRSYVKQIAALRDLPIQGTKLRDLVKWRDGLLTDRRGPVGANKIVGWPPWSPRPLRTTYGPNWSN